MIDGSIHVSKAGGPGQDVKLHISLVVNIHKGGGEVWNDGLLHTQCGTPVLRKNGYDEAKSDIWSCGVVLFVLLSGYLPFQHENVMKLYRKIFKAEFVFPPWISMDAKKLISRVLIAEDDKKITVTGIMKNPWFRKGFGREFSRVISVCSREREAGCDRGGGAGGDSSGAVEIGRRQYRESCEEDVRPALKDIRVWS
ncbi:hypothetical protein LWI29_026179 [Acer saccharum]|uniref:Protein kinase domain-containing protein n=1 Tax=Acer saccharum TaxID=4024 RepID=A0AA39RVC6_ACESA|nr:hypothetical protein LWI29_026179 [Acer saccharum]